MLIRLELRIDSDSPNCATLINISVTLLPAVLAHLVFVSCVLAVCTSVLCTDATLFSVFN